MAEEIIFDRNDGGWPLSDYLIYIVSRKFIIPINIIIRPVISYIFWETLFNSKPLKATSQSITKISYFI